jgi:hypothetical protein
MTSQSKSKAQRRAENQRRAEEKRRAEQRRQRVRIGLRVGGVLVVIVAAVVIITQVTGGGGHPTSSALANTPPQLKDPHVPLSAVPASMSSTWVQPPAGTPGPETVPIPSGPKLATLVNSATGQTVDGVQCQAGEQLDVHVHTHLTIFVDGKAQVIPYGIGIPGFQAVQTAEGPFVETGSCFYWLHVHANDGVIHVESPSQTLSFNLGMFFDEWGVTLSKTQVGPATGKVTVFFTAPGKKPGIYTGDPAYLPLGYHYQIQLDVGTPIVAPVQITNWGGL